MFKSTLSLIVLAIMALSAGAFVPPITFGRSNTRTCTCSSTTFSNNNKIVVPRLAMSFEEEFLQETPEATQERIQLLVEENPVILFMKGSKLFPQCGFSNTVCVCNVQ